MDGISLDYLHRAWGNHGFSYSLSRYAMLLVSGSLIDNGLVVWHGELPDTHFPEKTGKKSFFNKVITAAVLEQNQHVVIGGLLPEDDTPATILKASVPTSDSNPTELLLALD